MPRLNAAALKRAARNRKLVVRVVLGVLLAADLVAALLVFKPWTGSLSDLQRQEAALRSDLRQRQVTVERLRSNVGKVRTALSDGDKFMDSYLLDRRTLASNLIGELDQMARQAGIKQRDIGLGFEPIEGSDTLSKVTITASYEGAYADLVRFLNLLDHSPRLLIIESLTAQPQQSGAALNVTMKLNGFVRGGTPAAGPVRMASAQEAGQ